MSEILENDPNPVIMTADFNYEYRTRFDTYFKPLGFEIAAYDNSTHNMWYSNGKPGYCDMVIVNSKGHIDFDKDNFTVVDTYGSYSDHNLIIATLNVH